VTLGDTGNILLSGLSIGGVYALVVFMTTNVLNPANGALS
jgi:hypothetical protein